MPRTARSPSKPRRVPRERRVDVTRQEFDHLSALVTEASAALVSLRRELEIQFTRMAQIQSELEAVQRRIGHGADPAKR
jgi:chromosome segregation ATPase